MTLHDARIRAYNTQDDVVKRVLQQRDMRLLEKKFNDPSYFSKGYKRTPGIAHGDAFQI